MQNRDKGGRAALCALALFFCILGQAEARLEFLTYLGGAQLDQLHDIHMDDSGNAYVVGTTGSTGDFPTVNAIQGVYGGGTRDAFIMKFSVYSNAPAFSTYFGGDGQETIYGVEVDRSGCVYVVGATYSSNLSVTADAFQPILGGDSDGFIAKLDATGTNLLYCSYYGGVGADEFIDVVIDDESEAVFVVGASTNLGFPLITNAYQSAHAGVVDLVLMGLSLNITNVLFSTYFGGADEEASPSIVERNGALVIGLRTSSTNYPLLNPYQNSYGGGTYDSALTIFDTTGGLLFSSFYGGNGEDTGRTPLIDSDGDVYLIGWTTSTNLPGVSAGAFQPSLAGDEDGYLARFVQSGATNWTVANATYIGGVLQDRCIGSAMDAFDDIHITGITSSTNFPTMSALQPALSSTNSDGFFMRFYPKMRALNYSSYLGGTRSDEGRKIACDSSGNAFISGWVQSTTAQAFPVTNAWDSSFGGSRDSFLGMYHNAFITNYSLSASSLVGSFNSRSGRTYSVQSCSNVVDGTWTDLTNVTSTADSVSFTVDTTATTDRFFRVSF